MVVTWAYLPSTGPRYCKFATWHFSPACESSSSRAITVPGNALNVASVSFSICLALFMRWYALHENKLRSQGKRDHRLVGLDQGESDALGNR